MVFYQHCIAKKVVECFYDFYDYEKQVERKRGKSEKRFNSRVIEVRKTMQANIVSAVVLNSRLVYKDSDRCKFQKA